MGSLSDPPPPPRVDSGRGNSCHAMRSRWILDSPDPPSLWEQFLTFARKRLHRKGDHDKVEKMTSILSLASSLLCGIFPVVEWGRSYGVKKFKNDLMSGLTLASLCIPQSIGYAGLAKLDPEYGLYTNVVPPLIYALMGSSREIAIGPVAVVSLLLASMIELIVDPATDPSAYRKLVFTATFFAGTFQAVFGLFRLGFLIDFLSHAAIVGFMAGAAIVIGLQQLKGLLGFSHFTTRTDAVSVLGSSFKSLRHEWYPLNFILGCFFLIFLLVTRFIGRRNKKLFWLPAIAPLISVVLSTLLVYLSRADRHGVKIVKHIKKGLNPSSVHQLQFRNQHLGQAVKVGLVSSLVALTEAVAVGRSFASIKGYQIDGNREMMAMGFMNIAGSLTSCYVATGSFSRTAVNFSAGCETTVSNIVMAVTVALSLLIFTRLLYYTPVAILASIVLSALPGLIDLHEALRIWKVDKLDFLTCIGAFFGVLFGSVEIGLLIAVAISFGKVVVLSIRPGTEPLGMIPGTDIYCQTSQYPIAMKSPGTSLIRISAGLLCFANAQSIKQRIMRLVAEEEKAQSVILDMSSKHLKRFKTFPNDFVIESFISSTIADIMYIDTSGIDALEELHKELTSTGLEVGYADLKWRLIHKLKLSNFVERVGRERFFLSVGEAMAALPPSFSSSSKMALAADANSPSIDANSGSHTNNDNSSSPDTLRSRSFKGLEKFNGSSTCTILVNDH